MRSAEVSIQWGGLFLRLLLQLNVRCSPFMEVKPKKGRKVPEAVARPGGEPVEKDGGEV